MAALMRNVLRGAAAGFVATVPMTAFMLVRQRLLSNARQRRLAPERVTHQLLRKAGVRRRFGPGQFRAVAMGVHFGFGTTAGGCYGLLARRTAERPALFGILFGQFVWAETYQCLLPLAGLYPPRRRQSVGEQAGLVASHVIWGATLGLLLRSPRHGPRDRPRSGRTTPETYDEA